MDFALTPQQETLRTEVRELCARFPDEYWRRLDRERAYPEEFVTALTRSGYLAALIPKAYGGLGFGITEGSIVLEEINRSGGHSAADLRDSKHRTLLRVASRSWAAVVDAVRAGRTTPT